MLIGITIWILGLLAGIAIAATIKENQYRAVIDHQKKQIRDLRVDAIDMRNIIADMYDLLKCSFDADWLAETELADNIRKLAVDIE